MTHFPQEDYITKQECEDKIAKAIDNHNKTATLISASLGGVLLFFYADGMLRMIEKVTS